jgi:hypothetical protein
LLHREQVERRLVDFALGRIDHALPFQHHLAPGEVTLDISLAGTIHRLLRQASHAKQPLPQIVKPLLKTRAHDPNLPSRKSLVGRSSLVVGAKRLATWQQKNDEPPSVNNRSYPNLPVM